MSKTRWKLGLTTVAAIAFIMSAATITVLAGSPAADSPSRSAIKIDNFSFGPATLTIPAGATVTWTNRDDVPHVVTSDDKLFKSKALDTDDQFSFTFTNPGTYNYYCAIHPKMTAKIVVQ
jgi:plastocyanin